MSERTDGGPAFPCSSDVMKADEGLSMRDYFAAHATDEDIKDMQSCKPKGFITRQTARYMHADNMLKARSQ